MNTDANKETSKQTNTPLVWLLRSKGSSGGGRKNRLSPAESVCTRTSS